MRRALSLAARHRPHPNPRVGAVVLDASGEIVAEAAHRAPGEAHAERLALHQAGPAAASGTLVVTLEPCVHHGRTPPCTEAVLSSGVARVVIGIEDPDPRVAGRGIARLEAEGIEVIRWEAPDLIEDLDPAYFHHRRTGRPLVTLKVALTLDGQMAAIDGTSQWITGPEARADAHRLRATADAVIVGAGTLIADDPRLDVRLDDFDGPQPRAVIIAGQRQLPAGARIWDREPVVVAPGPVRIPAGTLLEVPGRGGSVDLQRAMTRLADLGLLDLLVEGGGGLAASLWQASLIDRGVFYLAGSIAGGVGRGAFDAPFSTLDMARPVTVTGLQTMGADLRVEWSV